MPSCFHFAAGIENTALYVHSSNKEIKYRNIKEKLGEVEDRWNIVL